MHAPQRIGDVVAQGRERSRQNVAARDHDIVPAITPSIRGKRGKGGTQPALHPVSFRCGPDLAAHGEPESHLVGRPGRTGGPFTGLQGQPRRAGAATLGRRDELGTLCETTRPARWLQRVGHGTRRWRDLTPKGACGRGRGGPRSPSGRPWWPCARGNHGGACARACWADRSVSRACLQSGPPRCGARGQMGLQKTKPAVNPPAHPSDSVRERSKAGGLMTEPPRKVNALMTVPERPKLRATGTRPR